MGAIGSVLSSNTKTIEPNQAATNIINAGSFDVCLITTPPMDAYFSLTNVDVNLEPCAAATVILWIPGRGLIAALITALRMI